jgi:hypothetical protein
VNASWAAADRLRLIDLGLCVSLHENVVLGSGCHQITQRRSFLLPKRCDGSNNDLPVLMNNQDGDEVGTVSSLAAGPILVTA